MCISTIFFVCFCLNVGIISYLIDLIYMWSIYLFCFFFSLHTERRYGCYRLGVFASIIIVLLLILGTIPVTLYIKNNQILLICLCSTLVVVTILLSLFIVWQQKQAKRQRERSTRPIIMQKQNKVKCDIAHVLQRLFHVGLKCFSFTWKVLAF